MRPEPEILGDLIRLCETLDTEAEIATRTGRDAAVSAEACRERSELIEEARLSLHLLVVKHHKLAKKGKS